MSQKTAMTNEQLTAAIQQLQEGQQQIADALTQGAPATRKVASFFGKHKTKILAAIGVVAAGGLGYAGYNQVSNKSETPLIEDVAE